MDPKSNYGALVQKCQELEATIALWMAANEAKATRIRELEALCSGLQQRVARLTRQVGRSGKTSSPAQVRHAR